jgi:predicted RNA-binding Zn-ribbon protein involved in translation (DUF1610 family)
MSDFNFNCISCGQSLEAPAEMVGQLIDCPSCGQIIEVCKQNPDIPRARPRNVAPAAFNRNNPNAPVFTMKGTGEILKVYSDKLEIIPQGAIGFIAKGLKGTKSIPFQSIVAIQFKESGNMLKTGYLQFTIPGGNESRGGIFNAAIDENTFMFAEQNYLAAKIKRYVESRISELRNPPQQQQLVQNNIPADLERLAALHQQGILSDDEFKQAKARLIR